MHTAPRRLDACTTAPATGRAGEIVPAYGFTQAERELTAAGHAAGVAH